MKQMRKCRPFFFIVVASRSGIRDMMQRGSEHKNVTGLKETYTLIFSFTVVTCI